MEVRLQHVVILSTLLVLASCTSGSDRGKEQGGKAAISIASGEVFRLQFENLESAGLEFDLVNDEGRTEYILYPGSGDESPTWKKTDPSGVIIRAGGGSLANSARLSFRLPDGLEPGIYSICSQNDECFAVRLEREG